MLKAFTHRPGEGWSELGDLRRISEAIAEPGELLWAYADIGSLTSEDAAQIAEEFGLHSLAVEDALNARQRPKVESYDNHLFVVVHQLDEVAGQLEARQIACFVGKDYVLTIHDGADRLVERAVARTRRTEREPGRGPSWIMHALVDAVVDEYQAIADAIEAEVEELEEGTLANPVGGSGQQVYTIKQRIARMRRYVMPGSRALAGFVEAARAGGGASETTAAYFRDVLDHTLRIGDQIRNVEDLVNAMMEFRRAEQANALNEVTKKLTGWAAIIAIPTLIASVYGMNFALFPREGSTTGFFVAVSAMGAAAAALYVFFKRRRWL
ncbi:MAG TPA: magnesium transporter CorA family protein [Actinomycetota bacterium]|nr:magnesium transporter CorA family protein [Actinomycetota bacterium]